MRHNPRHVNLNQFRHLYLYDAQNRLTEVQDNAGHRIASYQYDPFGRRIRKTLYRTWTGAAWDSLAEVHTTIYVYGDEGLIAEYRAEGHQAPQLVTQYGWQPEGTWGTDPVWIKTTLADGGSPAEYFYYQNDPLGTPQKIIDREGQSLWSQKSTAFGETTVDPVSVVVSHLRFPGQYFDAETGTHYNFFRDYNPALGRYIESDPMGLDGGINLYNYVRENPINNIDPAGLFLCGDWKWMAFDWLFGLGNPNRTYSGFPDQVSELRKIPLVQSAKAAYIAKNAAELFSDCCDPKNLKPLINYNIKFKAKEFIWATMHGNCAWHFVGSFRLDIYPITCKQARFVGTNNSRFTSFAYGIGPNWERSTFGPMGITSGRLIFGRRQRHK